MFVEMRRKATRPRWVLPFTLIVSVFLTFEGGTLLNAQEELVAVAYTNEELYRGLILADGPVAEVIPEVRDHLRITHLITERELLVAVRSLNSRIIEQIKVTDPRFLPTFGAAMRSGDHQRIDRALEVAGAITLRAAAELPEIVQLRAEIAADPSRRDELLHTLRTADGAESVSSQDLERAFDLMIADSASRGPAEAPQAASLVVVFVAAAAAILTVAALLNYAVAINIAGGVIFLAGVVTVRWVRVANQDWFVDSSLFREQLTHSVAVTLAS